MIHVFEICVGMCLTSDPQLCVSGVIPARFESFLACSKRLWHNPDQPPLITINAWNEWAEGSYLEPDTEFKYGFLKAVKRVFQ